MPKHMSKLMPTHMSMYMPTHVSIHMLAHVSIHVPTPMPVPMPIHISTRQLREASPWWIATCLAQAAWTGLFSVEQVSSPG